MMTQLAYLIVVATGVWLIGFAITIVISRSRAERFLKRFASSALAHYTEQGLRLIAGLGIVVSSSEMKFPRIVNGFGWLIIITSAGLFLVPWRWHHPFGQWATPLAIRHIYLYALGSFALGTLLLLAL